MLNLFDDVILESTIKIPSPFAKRAKEIGIFFFKDEYKSY